MINSDETRYITYHMRSKDAQRYQKFLGKNIGFSRKKHVSRRNIKKSEWWGQRHSTAHRALDLRIVNPYIPCGP